MNANHSRRAAALFASLFLLPALGAAQFQKARIVGDPNVVPGTNNWLYPLGPTANPFERPSSPSFPRTQAIARLGKILFWDEQLSSDNTVACGTCHVLSVAGTDPRAGKVATNGHIGSLGVIPQDVNDDYGDGLSGEVARQGTGQLSPPVVGAAFFDELFWDHRAGPDFKNAARTATLPGFTKFAALEDQASFPPVSSVEMAHAGITWTGITTKLAGAKPLVLGRNVPPDIAPLVSAATTYTNLFNQQFNDTLGVTRERIAMAIAHYQRTLVPNQAPIDLPNGLTQFQKDGFDLMFASGCFGCHSATRMPQLNATRNIVDPFDQLLSDGDKHFINLPGPGGDDMTADNVKTPTLRNLALRTRFFHSGEMTSVSQVVDFYNRSIGSTFFPFSGGSGPNGLLNATERLKVIDFLTNALTDPRVQAEQFPFDRPQLFSERFPFEINEYGTGTQGTAGLVPEIIANAPAYIDANNRFKLGVARALPGTTPFLGISTTPGPGPILWLGPLLGNQFFPAPTLTNGQGIGTFPLPLPNDPSLLGTTFFFQWAIPDPGSPIGVSLSDAAGVIINS